MLSSVPISITLFGDDINYTSINMQSMIRETLLAWRLSNRFRCGLSILLPWPTSQVPYAPTPQSAKSPANRHPIVCQFGLSSFFSIPRNRHCFLSDLHNQFHSDTLTCLLSLSLSKSESLLADYNVLHCAHSLTGCWCQYPATSVFAQASKNQAWFISIVSRYNNGAPFYRTYIDLP